jgi:hypothetical protein
MNFSVSCPPKAIIYKQIITLGAIIMSSYSDKISAKYSDKICMQRKADGDPCQSPALRDEMFCHYHKVTGKNAINLDNSPSGHSYLPVFEDAVSIQSAISDVCEMMLHRRIETKEASILLYAMQVASTNMAHLNGEKGVRKYVTKKKKNGAEPTSTAALPSTDASPASSTTSSSAAEPLPPGTIQACEREERPAFE